MINDLLKLSSYLNKTNKNYYNQIQQIIKKASKFEDNLSILNDYLIDMSKEPLKFLNLNSYNDMSAVLSKLYELYHKYKSTDQTFKILCNDVFNSIDDSKYFIALIHSNKLSLNKNFEIFKSVVKEIINDFIATSIESEVPHENERNDMINTFQQIYNANSIEEVYMLSGDLIIHNILHSNYSNHLRLFLNLMETFDESSPIYYLAELIKTEKHGNIDLLSVFKKHLNLDNLFD